ncbi:MAG: Trk system potassium transporter TrkA [Desulfobacteraceae bacterium]|nr:MAG: Trk system potassium transporter TrkA [Desulfobacteraceae bacterium]
MKIIIIGAGEVGFHTAQRLTTENKEVVVIDKQPEALKRFVELLDVQTFCGSGSSPRILEEAGIAGADMLLAVTDSDETNLVACMFTESISVGVRKLARIRDEDYFHFKPELAPTMLKIETIINPENELTKTVLNSLAVPGAEHINDFADGNIKLIGVRIEKESPVIGVRLHELRKKFGSLRFIIAAIFRNDRLTIPFGNDTINAGDLVYFVCETTQLKKVLKIFGSRTAPVHNILIVGCGNIGMKIAQEIEKQSYHLRIIEANRERCRFLAEKLNSAIVLHGDGTDKTLLEEENIRDIDMVISLTGNEEVNFLTSLLVKNMGAKRTMTRINKFAYMPIISDIGLGNIISPRLSAINSIIQHVRRGKILSSVSLKGEEAEVLEAVALETSGIVGTPLKNLNFPTGAIILAVAHGKTSIIPDGDTVIEPNDRVVILSTRKNIPRVERELMVKLEYF